MGDKPVQLELLSDPDEGKAEGFSYVLVKCLNICSDCYL